MTIFKTTFNMKGLSKRFSDESLTKKASLNALASLLDYGARVLVGFLVQPILVAGLGSYLYGIWQIVGRLIGYISAASGRPTQALKWTVANRQASTDYAEKRRQVGSAVVVWFLFLPLMAAVGGVLAWFAPVLLSVPAEYIWSVRAAAGVLVADLILLTLADMPQSVLGGENLGYKRMGLSTALVFAGGGLTAAAVYLHTGIVGVAVAHLAATLMTGILFLRIVRSYVPWFGLARPSRAEVRRFFGLSGWFQVWRLVMQLMMSSDVIVLGLLVSVETVTTYALTKYAPEMLISLVAIVAFGIAPGLGSVIGAGNLEKAARVRGEIMMGTWLISTVVGTTILLWIRSLMGLWVGAEYYAGPLPTLLIMLMMTQLVLIRNDSNVIDLTLNLRRKVLSGLLSAAASLIAASVFVGPLGLGIGGLCLGFMAGRSILSLGYPWLVGRALGMSPGAQLRSIPRPAFVMISLFSVATLAGNSLAVGSWIGLAILSGMTLIVVSALAFYAGLAGDQRKRVLKRVRHVIQPAEKD